MPRAAPDLQVNGVDNDQLVNFHVTAPPFETKGAVGPYVALDSGNSNSGKQYQIVPIN